MKIYVTFGQVHVHRYDGNTFDKDCVGAIEAPSYEEGRDKLFEIFKGIFCFTYDEKEFEKLDCMDYYPRGIIPIKWAKLAQETDND